MNYSNYSNYSLIHELVNLNVNSNEIFVWLFRTKYSNIRYIRFSPVFTYINSYKDTLQPRIVAYHLK